MNVTHMIVVVFGNVGICCKNAAVLSVTAERLVNGLGGVVVQVDKSRGFSLEKKHHCLYSVVFMDTQGKLI